MKGFAPFSAKELTEVKRAWIERDLRRILTGDVIKDFKIIEEYNKMRCEGYNNE